MNTPITVLPKQAFDQLSPTELQHILLFSSSPSNEELRLSVEEKMKKPFPVTGYRFIARADDNTAFLFEEIDILADIKESYLNEGYHVCHITITCRHCGERYRGWRKLPMKDYTAGPYFEQTNYCPSCPPISPEVWSRDFADLLADRPDAYIAPTRARINRPMRSTTLSAIDLDEFE